MSDKIGYEGKGNFRQLRLAMSVSCLLARGCAAGLMLVKSTGVNPEVFSKLATVRRARFLFPANHQCLP
jgi:hypothetical protein